MPHMEVRGKLWIFIFYPPPYRCMCVYVCVCLSVSLSLCITHVNMCASITVAIPIQGSIASASYLALTLQRMQICTTPVLHGFWRFEPKSLCLHSLHLTR